MLLIGLGGDVNALTYHEALAAEPAREMLDGRGNGLLQTIGGQIRANKPPGMSWMIAGAMGIFDSRDEWVVRVPAALSGVAIAWMVGYLGSRWLGRKVGIVAGLLQGTMLYTQFQARLAEADMPMAACVCGALLLYGLSAIDGNGWQGKWRWRSTLFYVLMAFTVLLKGVGPLFILPCVAIHALIAWRHRDALGRRITGPARFLLDGWGIGLMLLLVLGWGAAALMAHPEVWQTWVQQSAGRFAGQMQQESKTDPWFAYGYLVPWILLPWTPLVAIGAWRFWKAKLTWTPLGTFIACWVLPGLLILSLSAWKHRHYAIPMMPPLSLFASGALIALVNRVHRPGRIERWISAGAMMLAAIVAGWILWRYGQAYAAVGYLIITLLLGGGLIHLYLEVNRKPLMQLVAILGTAWCVAVFSRVMVMPKMDEYRPATDFARWAVQQIPPGDRLIVLGEGESQLFYYLPAQVRRVDDVEDLAGTVQLRVMAGTSMPASKETSPATGAMLPNTDTAQPVVTWIIARKRLENDLQRLGVVEPVKGMTVPTKKNPGELLQLYRLEMARPAME